MYKTIRRLLLGVVTFLALVALAAGPVLAGHCTNADKNPAAGVQVTINLVTGQITVSSGLQQRIDQGIVDPITFEGFSGLAGFDVTGDNVADLTSFLIKLAGDTDLQARFKSDPGATMEAEGLSPADQQIVRTGDEGQIQAAISAGGWTGDTPPIWLWRSSGS